ncbi:hypothetical protein DBZ45_04200 [Arthrobacter globiformis]|uniref:Uncharacterized protein n=1 Tax=Arthrobacter globiformis TaxID=1665 RepID=A0A328HMU9_ARTGO|nr:hypothetical protein DBZ45_04200 [Arthrobacter globiformis]
MRQWSFTQLRSFRNSRLLLMATGLCSAVILFEWDASLKTLIAVIAFVLALLCAYQSAQAWRELKSRQEKTPGSEKGA